MCFTGHLYLFFGKCLFRPFFAFTENRLFVVSALTMRVLCTHHLRSSTQPIILVPSPVALLLCLQIGFQVVSWRISMSTRLFTPSFLYLFVRYLSVSRCLCSCFLFALECCPERASPAAVCLAGSTVTFMTP